MTQPSYLKGSCLGEREGAKTDRMPGESIDPWALFWEPLQRYELTVIKMTYTLGWFQTQIFD